MIIFHIQIFKNIINKYNNMSNEPNLIGQNNNSIFKRINPNIFFDYEKYKCSPELIRNHEPYSFYYNNRNKNKNPQIYLNDKT